jgi:protein-S-isoprenylcysteine O-methyltransferase Ste14
MSKAHRPLASFCVGAVIFVGLPMAGWGLWDWHHFLADPARMVYCVLVIVLMAGAVVFVPDSGRSRSKGISPVKRQHVALVMVQILSLAIVIIPPYCDRRDIATIGGTPAVRYVGLLLFTVGYLIMNWAIIALGRQFSVEVTLQENHQLITTGPYHLVRHPRYLGILLFLGGFALIFSSWVGVVLTGLLLLVLLWRIYDEEKLLHQQFGAQWEQYAKATRRVIPWIL